MRAIALQRPGTLSSWRGNGLLRMACQCRGHGFRNGARSIKLTAISCFTFRLRSRHYLEAGRNPGPLRSLQSAAVTTRRALLIVRKSDPASAPNFTRKHTARHWPSRSITCSNVRQPIWKLRWRWLAGGQSHGDNPARYLVSGWQSGRAGNSAVTKAAIGSIDPHKTCFPMFQTGKLTNDLGKSWRRLAGGLSPRRE